MPVVHPEKAGTDWRSVSPPRSLHAEVDQPPVSAQSRGELDGFSTDRLFQFLNALSPNVEIAVRPSRGEHGHGSTRVVNG